MLSVAVLISGGGTTLRNLIQRVAEETLAARIALVISSNPQAAGLEFARRAGIPCEVAIRSRTTAEAYRDQIFGACRTAGADLVVMGGFLKHVLIPTDYQNRVINIHPSLIPAFCGAGMFGRHVHEAALAQGVKVSGCTVHFVDDQYDHGPIILQRVVPVQDDDTPETLAARVFEQECLALPEAIQLFAGGRLDVRNGRVYRRR